MLFNMYRLLKRSTFLRLLAIFIFSAIILLLLFASASHLINDSHLQIKKKFKHNIVSYSQYLINEIGDPVDYRIAQKLSTDNSLYIRIRDLKNDWKSENYNLPALLKSEQKVNKDNRNIIIGHNFTYSYIILSKNSIEYIIAFTHRRFSNNIELFIFILIILGVTSMNYYLVRWLFRPIRLLDEGVKQVGEGNFEFRVITRRQDEMGELVQAFNQMSEKIQSMMQEKEQLLMDVSHELRSPITRMKLALEFIEDNKSKTSVKEDLNEMEAMITELLESARLNNPNSPLLKENINLSHFINSIAKSYYNYSPGIKVQSIASSLFILADRKRLYICLHNIIDNALKYSSKQNKPVIIEATQNLDKVHIKITDFGVGIPIDDQAHIFEPFYRVDKSRSSQTGGYGLGLNLSNNIIKAHNGEIIVASRENEQTSFTLVL